MPAHYQTEALQLLKSELNGLGYVGNLLRENYEFADVLSEGAAVNEIRLAAFAQDPPSYRNAAFGVAIANGHSGPGLIQMHTALGAPQIFEVNNNSVSQWKVSSAGNPSLLNQLTLEELPQLFAQNKTAWDPQRILQAKSDSSLAVQLDFFDAGLLPLLEQEARTKLDNRLRNVVALAIGTYEKRAKFTPDLYPMLFRLIFRFIAAKLLADRRYPGDWNTEYPKVALQAVEDFYSAGGHSEPALEDRDTQEETWKWINQTCHFQNLSVDSLAYVYENTFVTQQTRKAYSTHSTPYAIAEYIVRNLPFENLHPSERKVFEPFSGHSIFLIAAMQRMRELLPPEMEPKDRHDYFIKMLSGIENDEFALEVGRLSLMLADYPNPDGWRLHRADAFASPLFPEELRHANIVLCNPPFEPFNKVEKTRYGDILSTTKAREALLRVLEDPPQLLGFVLPRVFMEGPRYRELRVKLGEIYNTFELLALPDRVFEHSDAETVVLLSAKGDITHKSLTVGQVLNSNLQEFYISKKASYQAQALVEEPAKEFVQRIWLTQLGEVWDTTREFRTLGTLAEIHRGIEYNRPIVKDIDQFVSSIARPDFVPGLHKVDDNIEPFIVTQTVYLDTSQELMRGSAYKYNWNAPKLIVNANPQSRGNWRITASIDRSGLVCYQNFHAIWPKTELSLEVIAAVLNGPVANAFISTRDSIRHVLIRTLRNIPIPDFSLEQEQALVSLVHQYTATCNQGLTNQLNEHEARSECRRLISAIDAEVLKAYGLPLEQERALLEWFKGSRRLGPFEFTEYFPQSFEPLIPWHQYVNETAIASAIATTMSEKTLLFNALQADFVAEPVEDGVDHEAERTLARALSGNTEGNVFDWLLEFCTDESQPEFASSVLRCLSSLEPPGTPIWRANLVRTALGKDDVEIREAAVQVVEHWGEDHLLDVLRGHRDEEIWLHRYVQGVIEDLRG